MRFGCERDYTLSRLFVFLGSFVPPAMFFEIQLANAAICGTMKIEDFDALDHNATVEHKRFVRYNISIRKAVQHGEEEIACWY